MMWTAVRMGAVECLFYCRNFEDWQMNNKIDFHGHGLSGWNPSTEEQHMPAEAASQMGEAPRLMLRPFQPKSGDWGVKPESLSCDGGELRGAYLAPLLSFEWGRSLSAQDWLPVFFSRSKRQSLRDHLAQAGHIPTRAERVYLVGGELPHVSHLEWVMVHLAAPPFPTTCDVELQANGPEKLLQLCVKWEIFKEGWHPEAKTDSEKQSHQRTFATAQSCWNWLHSRGLKPSAKRKVIWEKDPQKVASREGDSRDLSADAIGKNPLPEYLTEKLGPGWENSHAHKARFTANLLMDVLHL